MEIAHLRSGLRVRQNVEEVPGWDFLCGLGQEGTLDQVNRHDFTFRDVTAHDASTTCPYALTLAQYLDPMPDNELIIEETDPEPSTEDGETPDFTPPPNGTRVEVIHTGSVNHARLTTGEIYVFNRRETLEDSYTLTGIETYYFLGRHLRALFARLRIMEPVPGSAPVVPPAPALRTGMSVRVIAPGVVDGATLGVGQVYEYRAPTELTSYYRLVGHGHRWIFNPPTWRNEVLPRVEVMAETEAVADPLAVPTETPATPLPPVGTTLKVVATFTHEGCSFEVGEIYTVARLDGAYSQLKGRGSASHKEPWFVPRQLRGVMGHWLAVVTAEEVRAIEAERTRLNAEALAGLRRGSRLRLNSLKPGADGSVQRSNVGRAMRVDDLQFGGNSVRIMDPQGRGFCLPHAELAEDLKRFTLLPPLREGQVNVFEETLDESTRKLIETRPDAAMPGSTPGSTVRALVRSALGIAPTVAATPTTTEGWKAFVEDTPLPDGVVRPPVVIPENAIPAPVRPAAATRPTGPAPDTYTVRVTLEGREEGSQPASRRVYVTGNIEVPSEVVAQGREAIEEWVSDQVTDQGDLRNITRDRGDWDTYGDIESNGEMEIDSDEPPDVSDSDLRRVLREHEQYGPVTAEDAPDDDDDDDDDDDTDDDTDEPDGD